MKNVLILCDIFPPAFSPRMGYLCKYLPALGWNPIIITEYSPQNIYKNLAENQDVTYINYYWSKNKICQHLKYIFVFLADFFFNYKNYIIRKKAKNIIREQHISVILSSSYRTYPALAACQLSRRYGIPLVMDLRDIFEQSQNNELISKKISGQKWINNIIASIIKTKLMRQRNKILKIADCVTTVSDWHVKTLSEYNPNVNLIYNGYDSELFYPEKMENEKFIITYAGRLHSQELRNPSLLFEAVEKLSAEEKINPKTFRIHFYLTDKTSKEIVLALAQKYAVTEFIDYFAGVQNTKIPTILNESSILLLLANKSSEEKGPKGIMGTKLFEYLAVEKPILCIRNDEDCLEKTINSANAGLAASTAEETADFILEKYAEWQQNGYTRQLVNREFIQQFSRKRQAEEFVGIFESLECCC